VIELLKAVNMTLNASELANINSDVSNVYGVNEDDVTIEVVYETSGSLHLTLTDGVDLRELEEALQEELALILGIHESHVRVDVTNETAVYTIVSDSVEDAKGFSSLLETANATSMIDKILSEQFGASVESIVVDDTIVADVVITVDTSDAKHNLADAAESVVNILTDDGYNTTATNMFITSSPTRSPSTVPTLVPVTQQPSAKPSMTGKIASISMSGLVTEDISAGDVDDIRSDLIGIYDVTDDDIQMEIQYIASGMLNVTIGDDTSEDDAIAVITASLSELLGVHNRQVSVTVDTDGSVTYFVTEDSFDEASRIVNATNADGFAKQLEGKIALSGVIVESIEPDGAVEIVIVATIDITEGTEPDVDVVDIIANISFVYGLSNGTFEEHVVTSLPTFQPSAIPVTSVPTTVPSVTGLVVSIAISHSTSHALNDEELVGLENAVALAYSVNPEDVTSSTAYIVSGTLNVDIDSSMTEESAQDALVAAMTTVLGVNEESITVEIDLESGEATYTVSVPEFNDASVIQSALDDDSVPAQLSVQGISVTAVFPDASVLAETTFVIDGDEVTVSLITAENTLDAILDKEYTSDVEGISFVVLCLNIFSMIILFLLSQLCDSFSHKHSIDTTINEPDIHSSIHASVHYWSGCVCGNECRCVLIII